MSAATRPTLAALVFASLPAAAHAGVAFEGVRTVAVAGGSPTLEIRTAGADADAALRLDATLTAPSGESTALDCAAAGVRQVASAVVDGAFEKGALTLSVAGAGGTIATYTGFVDADGVLVLLDDSSRGLGPAAGGFLVVTEAGTVEAVLTLDDAEKEAVSAVLTVDGTEVDLAFGAPTTTWSCALPDAGPATLDLTLSAGRAAGRAGKTVWTRADALTTELGLAWESPKGDVSSLSLGDAGLTSLALLPPAVDGCGWGAGCAAPEAHALVAVSDGWYAEDALPTHLDLDAPGGDTLRLALNSAQRTGAAPLSFGVEPTGKPIDIVSDGGTVRVIAGGEVACGTATCFRVTKDASGWSLVATAYRGAAAALPTTVKVGFGSTKPDAGTVSPKESTVQVTLFDEVALVFARAVSPGEGALGAPISFKPSLIGLEQDGIHTTTYTAGSLVRGAVGEGVRGLALVALDRAGPPRSTPAALLAGEPIGLDRESDAGGLEPVGPPVVWGANGAGTRSAIPSTRNKPGLR